MRLSKIHIPTDKSLVLCQDEDGLWWASTMEWRCSIEAYGETPGIATARLCKMIPEMDAISKEHGDPPIPRITDFGDFIDRLIQFGRRRFKECGDDDGYYGPVTPTPKGSE